MRIFLIASCLLVAVAARPEAPFLYNGLPQQQSQRALPLNAHPAQPHVYQQLPQEHSFASFVSQPQMNYLPPNAVDAHIAPETQPSAVMVAPIEAPLEDSYNMAHRLSSTPHASGYAQGPVETKIHKHIYVHVPPKDFEEEDAIQPRVHHQVGPKQKHYKIVFIKAPSAPAVRAPIVAPPPQNEEKTLIYVLHKKPEVEQDIVIPTPAPTKPSKPEVYFIKYKTKKEEAPVYGPPPATFVDTEPRHVASADDFPAMPNADVVLPTTTAETIAEEPQQPLDAEVPAPAQVYGAPTAPSYVADEVQTTLASPSIQYLPPSTATAPADIPEEIPSMAPIVVEEQTEARVPAANYGPPNRFFIKKRK